MLLDNAGRPTADRFVTLAEDGPAPLAGSVIVPLARLLAEPALAAGPLELGVLLSGGAELDKVLPLLGRLALVAVTFPVFRDGRAFTLTRALREEHAFTGEIRATGHVLPDQYVFLVRCGISTVELEEDADASVWAAALRRQSHPDQPPAERAQPLLRRIALPFATG